MPDAPPDLTPASVANWLQHASPEQLRELGAERLLEAASKALASKTDSTLDDLAAEVEDVLRRCAAEHAAT
jgi:hypothetical protein